MAKLLRMPEIAANTPDAVLQEWMVPDNTPFAVDDAVAAVETDKAVVDVPAEEPGVILKRLVDAGARVAVGAPIAVLGTVGEQVADLAGLLAELGVTRAHEPAAESRGHECGTRAGRTGDSPVPNVGLAGRTFASPLARRLAKEAGLPVEDIVGTGPGGRVVRRDVEAAIAARGPAAPAPAPAAPAPVVPPAAAGTGYTEVPHSRMRRAIAARLTESKQTAPHFYLRATVRVDKLLKLRERLNKDSTVRVSVNDLIVKAAARAHTLVPEMNVTWTPDAVRQYSSVDIAVAVATERGLLTPVVSDAANRSITSVSTAIADLAARAKDGTLRQDELTGGTLSVTNLGMFGTEEFAAIINPPQAAILAVGAAREEPVARLGRLTTATVLRVTLSVDHRPVDGVVAARWLAAFVDTIEKPVRILA